MLLRARPSFSNNRLKNFRENASNSKTSFSNNRLKNFRENASKSKASLL